MHTHVFMQLSSLMGFQQPLHSSVLMLTSLAIWLGIFGSPLRREGFTPRLHGHNFCCTHVSSGYVVQCACDYRLLLIA